MNMTQSKATVTIDQPANGSIPPDHRVLENVRIFVRADRVYGKGKGDRSGEMLFDYDTVVDVVKDSRQKFTVTLADGTTLQSVQTCGCGS